MRKLFIIAVLFLSCFSVFTAQKNLRVDTTSGECDQSVDFTGTTEILGALLNLNKWDGTIAPAVSPVTSPEDVCQTAVMSPLPPPV